jgi:hypothetical protein
MTDKEFALGQLRHLYQMMLDGLVDDTAQAAKFLLGPAIEKLEHEPEPKGIVFTPDELMWIDASIGNTREDTEDMMISDPKSPDYPKWIKIINQLNALMEKIEQ